MSFLKRLFGNDTIAEDNLRIIITRHGERTDFILGPKWVSKAQQSGQIDRRVSYLAPRETFDEWTHDPPLTVDGERQSMWIGKKLRHYGYSIDYCYSSPAYRSIQTANRILQSQGRSDVPINIEPGLFECPLWYGEAPLTFIPPDQLAGDRHFNINSDYTPIYNTIDMNENEKHYYKRSRALIDSIIERHKHQGGTILLSGHAGSIEVITRGMLGRRARPRQLYQEASKVNYCNFAVLERDAITKRWSVHEPGSNDNPFGMQQPVQTSIPLHQPTSYHVPTSHLRTYPITDASYYRHQSRRRHQHQHHHHHHALPPPHYHY